MTENNIGNRNWLSGKIIMIGLLAVCLMVTAAQAYTGTHDETHQVVVTHTGSDYSYHDSGIHEANPVTTISADCPYRTGGNRNGNNTWCGTRGCRWQNS
ncbi:MAG: hypothetical protein ABFC24_08270 [Methanoregulaceae archaeon]